MSGEVLSSSLGGFLGGDVQTYLAIFLASIVLLWLTALVWVLKDSIARSNSVFFHICSVLLITLLTPLIGLPIYLAIRPVYYHPRKYYGRALLYSLTVPCPSCHVINDRNNYFCTSCGHGLTGQCRFCGTNFVQGDEFCFHCGRSTQEEQKAELPSEEKKAAS